MLRPSELLSFVVPGEDVTLGDCGLIAIFGCAVVNRRRRCVTVRARWGGRLRRERGSPAGRSLRIRTCPLATGIRSASSFSCTRGDSTMRRNVANACSCSCIGSLLRRRMANHGKQEPNRDDQDHDQDEHAHSFNATSTADSSSVVRATWQR